MSITYGGDTIIDSSGGILRPISSVMRNRIINGAMVIDQRNAGASVTPTTDTYILDRWKALATVTSKYSVQQNAGSVTPPTGFTNYVGFTSLSAYSISSSDIFGFDQRIEGYSISDLGWGTANAKTVTLSFQVYSSLTGTFGGSLSNSAATRSYPFTYTISSANTWTQISVTIAGDTSGTWLTTNGIGIRVQFGLGVGSTYSGTAGSWAGANYVSATGATSVVGTSGATFYITGVQLEVGSSATGFEYRQYQQELALCQRYYEKSYDYATVAGTAGVQSGFKSMVSTVAAGAETTGFSFVVDKRATPTVTIYNAVSGASGQSYRVSDASTISTTLNYIGTKNVGTMSLALNNANAYYVHYVAVSEL